MEKLPGKKSSRASTDSPAPPRTLEREKAPVRTPYVLEEDTSALSEVMAEPCKKEFEWKAELICRADKPLQIKIGDKEISGSNELLTITFEISGRCVDGDLTLDDPKKKTELTDPTLGFKKPDWMEAGPWKKFTKMIPDAYDKFKAKPTITVNKKTECCAEVSFGAELSSEGEFKVGIPVPGEKDIPVELKFPAKYPPVKAVWTICCCDADDDKCNWSARKDKFEWEEAKSANWTIRWVLNAHLGGCGKVKWVEKIKKASFL